MPSIPRICSIDNCNNIHEGRGYCRAHYDRWRRGVEIDAYIKPQEDHRLTNTPVYVIWLNIKQRTCNPKNPAYHDYGARGIEICDRWRLSFKSFIGDVGEKPNVNDTLDRIDNDSGYSCGKCEHCKLNSWSMNVRWTSRYTQVMNTRAKPNPLGYRGVKYINDKYITRITIYGKRYQVGRYDTLKEAAQAYNDELRKYYGDDAIYNVIE